MDEDVREIVKKWPAPLPGREFDAAMLEKFRKRRQPIWKRLVYARVQVPVPVLAVSIMVFALAILLTWARPDRQSEPSGWEPVADPRLRVIRAEGGR